MAALVYYDPAGSSTTFTYAELERQQDAVARALVERGVGRGQRVADFCDEGPSLVLAMLGVLRAGATVVPLDPTQPSARLVALLRDCNAMLSVCSDAGRPALASRLAGPSGPPLATLEGLAEAGRDLHCSLDSRCSDDGCVLESGLSSCGAGASSLSHIIYTSGSTGPPKGVACERRALLAYARAKVCT